MASNSSSEYRVVADQIVSSDEDIMVKVSGAMYKDSIIEANRYANISDIGDNGAVSNEISFTVNGGSTGTQPTFSGSPLFSGSYVIAGPLVYFDIQVDMDNITGFGTGQYYVDLPFTAKHSVQFKQACLHDISSGKQYALGGHVAAGSSRVLLTYTNSNGQDDEFDHNSPVSLTTADNFHISGTYIANFS
jgi:hypothetical protein